MSETTETTSAAQTQTQASTTEAAAATTSTAAATTATAAATTEAPFYDAWAPELKESPSVLRYKSAEDLARAYVAAEKKLGVPADQLLRLPKGLDDKEGIGAIMKALGAPDSADGYKLEMGEGAAPEDLALAKDFAKHVFEKTQAPPAFVAAALEWFAGQNKTFAESQAAALKAASEAGEAELKTAWGADYDRRLKEVGRLMNENGGEAFYADLEKAGLANHPKLLLMFGKLIDKMAEPAGVAGGARGETGGQLTPGQAKAKRLELEADPLKAKALNDASHPQHKAIVEERRAYFKLERGLT